MGLFSNHKVDQLIAKITELREALEQSRGELTSAKEVARSAREEARSAREQLNGQKEAAREQIKREQDKVRSVTDSRAHLEARVAELETELSDAKSKLDDQRTKLSEAEDQIVGLRGAQEALASKDAEVTALTANLKSAERALEREPHEVELHHKVNVLTESKQRLEQQVNQLKSRVKKLETERQASRTESANKAMTTERTIRELRYRVELDRRAYVIQQLELESAISRAKGAEQRFELKTQEAIKRARTEALDLVDAELRAELAATKAELTELGRTLREERRQAALAVTVIAEVVEASPQPFTPSAMTEEDWQKIEASEPVAEQEPEAEPVAEQEPEEEPDAE